MRARKLSLTLLSAVVLAPAVLMGCSSPASAPETSAAAQTAAAPPQEKGGQDEFGPYDVVANWPLPLEDGPDGVKHEGWTWGSVGAVWAETPDRIWIAQRGELPLPKGAKPLDALRHAQSPSRGDRQRRWDQRHVRSGAQARMGAALPPLHLRGESRRQGWSNGGRTRIRRSFSRCDAGADRTRSR